VLLFGPVAPSLWGPPERARHTVLWHGDGRSPGDPHAGTVDPALARIGVDEVIEACRARLASAGQGVVVAASASAAAP
jgi:hypothetical protein